MKFIFSLAAVCFYTCVLSQGDVPVNMYTGTPAITVPLWSFEAHDLHETFGVFYDASGLKLEQSPNHIGLGWGISGAGRITRDVRGLPDDFDGIDEARVGTTNHDKRRGWLHKMVGENIAPNKSIGDFHPLSDLSASTCSDEIIDYNKIYAYYSVDDTEPDLFHISAPGLSGSFVFDNSSTPQIRLIPLQEVKIDYTLHAVTKDIIAFKVTKDNGVVYHFTILSEEKRSMKSLNDNAFFSTEFSLFNNTVEGGLNFYTGHVKFNSGWLLEKIESPSGARIDYRYRPFAFETTDTLRVGIRKDNVDEIESIPYYEIYSKKDNLLLEWITTSAGQRMRLYYDDQGLSKATVFDDRRGTNPIVKSFNFVHTIGSHPSDTSARRLFLTAIQEEAGSIKLPPYRFYYTGLRANGEIDLPSHHSYSKDFWGYFNGKKNTSLYPQLYVYPSLDYPNKVRTHPIPGQAGLITVTGADRNSDFRFMEIGSLAKVEYPLGGILKIQYEANSFLDPTANATVTGGGLRIKSLGYYDAVNTAQTLFREYQYETSPGVSSGKLMENLVFYVPTAKYVWNTVTKTYAQLAGGPAQALWERLLARSEENLSTNVGIAYAKAAVIFPGNGKTVYDYLIPATSAENASGDWEATEIKFARSTGCGAMGIMNSGGTWRFPFARNPNFNHERGLIDRISVYNEQGQELKRTTYSYQSLYKIGAMSAHKVWGLSYSPFPHGTGTFLFGRYFLLTEITKVPISETVQTFEAGTANAASMSKEYLYESQFHRSLTSLKMTNSDGSEMIEKFKYPLDYGSIATSTDTTAQMISALQTAFRNSTPIESWLVHKNSETDPEKVISGQLLTFSQFDGTIPLPKYHYQLSTATPLTDFEPSAIASGTFSKDDRYELQRKIRSYENTIKVPISVEDAIAKTITSQVWGHNMSAPVASVKYAELDNIAYSDFETTSTCSFFQSGEIYGRGRTGERAIHPSVTLNKTQIKRPAGVTTYKLSFWIKTNGTSVTFNIYLKNIAGSTLESKTVSANSTVPGEFTLVEQVIQLGFLASASAFQIEITSTLPAGTYFSHPDLLPVIDDVEFAPEFAEIEKYAYKFPFGISATTDYADRTTIQEFDGMGNVSAQRDIDGNIRASKRIIFNNGIDELNPEFEVFDPEDQDVSDNLPFPQNDTKGITVRQNVPVLLLAKEDAHENVTYEWDYNTGFTTGVKEQIKIFPNSGVANVKLRVSKNGYTTQISDPIKVTIRSQLTIHAEGVQIFNPETGFYTTKFPNGSIITETAADNETIFKLAPVPSGVSVQFQSRSIGATNWFDVYDGHTYRKTNIHLLNHGFEVRCITKATTYPYEIKGESNVIRVLFQN